MTAASLTFSTQKLRRSKSIPKKAPRIVEDLLLAISTVGELGLRGRLGVRIQGRHGDAWVIDLSKPHRGFRVIGEKTFQQCETRISLSSTTFEGPWEVDGDRGILQIIETHLKNFQSAVLS